MPKAILPRIFDITRLFSLSGHNYQISPFAPYPTESPKPSSPLQENQVGFPRGSTILISGPPGSGKSTFSLAIVRSLFFTELALGGGEQSSAGVKGDTERTPGVAAAPQVVDVHPAPVAEFTETGKSSSEPPSGALPLVVYVSPEINRNRLVAHFGQFGWFDEDDKTFDCAGQNFVALRVSERELERPFLGADELVNVVFSELKAFCANPRYQGREVVVVVDSLTSVLKDSPTPGEWRRQTHDFLNRLRELLEDRLALAFLLSERMEASPTEVPTEEHVADIVLQLWVKKTGSGHVLRCVNVVKSRGVFMNLGEHTWAILIREDLGRVIGEPSLIEALRRYLDAQESICDEQNEADQEHEPGKSNSQPRKWGTIAIFPRPRLPSIGGRPTPNLGQSRTVHYVSTGIHGLDEMLLGIELNPLGGGLRESPTNHLRGLSAGSTTLVVGGSGTGKSSFCMSFCKAAENWSRSLYVNFENDLERLQEYHRIENPKDAKDRLNTIYRRRGNLDVNLLLAEIKHVILSKQINKIAIDGLSDLLSTTTEGEYSRFVETLLEWIRFWGNNRPESSAQRKSSTETQSPLEVQRITLMVTFEIDANLHLLPQTHGLSLTADNVIILKQIKLNDQLHRAIYVPKVRGENHSRQVREVISELAASNGMPTERRDAIVSIQPGFESYFDILSDHPTRIEFNLQLFQENQAEAAYNRQLSRELSRTFGYRFNLFRFTNTENTRALCDHLMRKPGVIPPADVRIISVDEWWVRECAVEAQQNLKSKKFNDAIWNPWLKGTFKSRPANESSSSTLGIAGYPLYSFTSAVSARSSDPETGAEEADQELLRQFWHFEVEKGLAIAPKRTLPSASGPKAALPIQAEVLALPYIMDYGMFCVNSSCLAIGEKPSDDGGPKVTEYGLANSLDMGIRSALIASFHDIDWIWAEPTEVKVESTTLDWWHSPSDTSRTVLGYATQMKMRSNGVIKHCIVFDAEIPESGVCFLLELMWALGAREDALDLSSSENKGPSGATAPEQHELSKAFRFLGFLVLEGLMPARPRIDESRRAVFSRHWYSTLVKCQANLSDDLARQRDSGATETKYLGRPIAIPDLPGFRGQTLDLEEEERGIRLHRRLVAALGLGVPAGKDLSGNISSGPSVNVLSASLEDENVMSMLASRRRTLGQIAELPRDLVPDSIRNDSSSLPELAAAVAFDTRDLRLLESAQRRRDAMRSAAKLEPDAGWGGVRFAKGITGFCAAGSWLVGVKAPAHSPKMSWDVLKELTSLRESTDRAASGVGLPARKDFMEFKGSEPVKSAEHLSWRELLVACLSRSRRRDRVIPPGVHGLPVYSDLHREMLAILSLAGELRDQYRTSGDRGRVIQIVHAASTEAVRRISGHIEMIRGQVERKNSENS